MKQWNVAVFLILQLLVTGIGSADPIDKKQIPAPLNPWVDWVMYGEEEKGCPFFFSNGNQHHCTWATPLKLTVTAGSGTFSQRWQVDAPAWIPLPGSSNDWPQQVRINNRPASVTLNKQRPMIKLQPGNYLLEGRFQWSKQPEYIPLPPATGIVQLTVNGRKIAFPYIDNEQRLWVKKRSQSGQEQEHRYINVSVYRKLTDSIPQQITTVIELDVAGEQREVLLGPVVPYNYMPIGMQAPIPARLEPDGRLRTQVRPGRWLITLEHRTLRDTTEFSPPPRGEKMPQQEIWSFEAQRNVRLVEVEGGRTIAPEQTRLPIEAWKQLPAYAMEPNDKLTLKVIRRGDDTPNPNKLNLVRNLWLDFAGSGYTVSDNLSGSMTRGWRLDASPRLQLGRVEADGQPRFITRLPASDRQGIEVRRGLINVNAISRYADGISRIPVTGWQQDFQQVSARLHLPPGWTPFYIGGTDNTPNTWLQRWSLLDLFLVFILSLSIARLWNIKWGLAGLLTLALIWHEPEAPRYIWINLLAIIALLRVIPQGNLQNWARRYLSISWVVLVLISIGFMIHEIRTGLHPQLAQESYFPQPPAMETDLGIMEEAKMAAPSLSLLEQESYRAENYSAPRKKLKQQRLMDEIDPNAVIQTGPGLPEWQWRSLPLNWNGPVSQEQELTLLFIPPWLNLILSFIKAFALAALILLLLGVRYDKASGVRYTGGGVLALLCAVVLAFHPGDTMAADIPDAAMLKELKDKLLAPADCLPRCADIARMRLVAEPERLIIRLEIHTRRHVSVPLPGKRDQWLPDKVMLGERTLPLTRSDTGELRLPLPPGSHQVLLSGPLPDSDSVQLHFPLSPHQVERRLRGWRLEGVHEDGTMDNVLQLNRARQISRGGVRLQPGTMPPFVHLQRTLHLGLDWYMTTQLLKQNDSAAVLSIPLLEGESVVSDGIRVEGGVIKLTMEAGQKQLQWRSVLEKRPALSLEANPSTTWMEVWRLDVSPILHLETRGLAPIHHTNADNRWLPEWRPWPGETLTLAVSRPEGVEGETLTLQNSHLTIQPGKRKTEVNLSLRYRSSQGGQHTISVPAGIELQSVRLDQQEQPIRLNKQQLTLPVQPGEHQVEIRWREPRGVSPWFSGPAVNLGQDSANHHQVMELGQDRWILLVSGGLMRPAVLIWGVIIVIFFITLALGRTGLTPLKSWQWFLLCLGLTQTSVEGAFIIIAWLLALGWRGKAPKEFLERYLNPIQAALILLTLAALFILVIAISMGLLGSPDMMVRGNQSYATHLNWFFDRVSATPEPVWVLSLPILVYRLLMLAWALWMAFALLKWLQWGWGCFTHHRLWINPDKKANKKTRPKPPKGDTPPAAEADAKETDTGKEGE